MSYSPSIATLKRTEKLTSELFRHCTLHKPVGPFGDHFCNKPQMVVLFTWLGAKEKTAHKFVHAWTRRGFHVMNVTTSVTDLLCPRSLAEPTAMRIVDYLTKHDSYNILIHGLSVGGYLGQRVLMMSQNTDVSDRVSHQIYDSFTSTKGLQGGVENATNPRYRKIATLIGKLYAKYADLNSFWETESFIKESTAPSPVLFMHSMADVVSQYPYLLPLVRGMARDQKVYTYILPKEMEIKHVTMFRKMGEQPYMKVITDFLAKDSKLSDHEARLNLDDERSRIENATWNESISFNKFVMDV